MRTQRTADECGISDIRYEDGSSLKKILQGKLGSFGFAICIQPCYKIDSK